MSTSAGAAEKRLVAVIMVNAQSRYQDIHQVFTDNSGSFCNGECTLYVQTPNNDSMSLRNSVRKAVALGASLIVTYGPAATLAAQAEATRVPTLFADVYDPVSLGLVAANKMTGRNMTGIRGDAPVQTLFKYFMEAAGARKLAVLYDPSCREGRLQKATLEESAVKKGVAILSVAAAGPAAYRHALQDLPADIDGLFLAASTQSDAEVARFLQLAAQRHLPVITQRPGAAEMGAFMVLESSASEQGEKLAEMAGLVLAGSKIDLIPLSRPRQVAFVVNLQVAKDCGLQLPFQTLANASRLVR